MRPDVDAGFRIEGTAWLRLPFSGPARADQGFGRVHRMVAGEGYVPSERKIWLDEAFAA